MTDLFFKLVLALGLVIWASYTEMRIQELDDRYNSTMLSKYVLEESRADRAKVEWLMAQ